MKIIEVFQNMKKFIKDNSLNRQRLAMYLHISEPTLYRKMNTDTFTTIEGLNVIKFHAEEKKIHTKDISEFQKEIEEMELEILAGNFD